MSNASLIAGLRKEAAQLTRERDDARKRVENLERAIRDPFDAARAITPLAFARYLEATGWTRAVSPFWTKPGRQPISVDGTDLIAIVRQMGNLLPIILADIAEHADAPR